MWLKRAGERLLEHGVKALLVAVKPLEVALRAPRYVEAANLRIEAMQRRMREAGLCSCWHATIDEDDTKCAACGGRCEPMFAAAPVPAAEGCMPRVAGFPSILLSFDAPRGAGRGTVSLAATGSYLDHVDAALRLVGSPAQVEFTPDDFGGCTTGAVEGALPAQCAIVRDALLAVGFYVVWGVDNRPQAVEAAAELAALREKLLRAEAAQEKAERDERELGVAVNEVLGEHDITLDEHSAGGVKAALEQLVTKVAAEAQLPYVRAQMAAIGGGNVAAGVARFNGPAPERRPHHADAEGLVPSGFPRHVSRDGTPTYPEGTVFTPVAPPLEGAAPAAPSARPDLDNPTRLLEALAGIVDEDDCYFADVEGRQTCTREGCRRCEVERGRALLEQALAGALAVEVRRRALQEAMGACRGVERIMLTDYVDRAKPIPGPNVGAAFSAVAAACWVAVEKLLTGPVAAAASQLDGRADIDVVHVELWGVFQGDEYEPRALSVHLDKEEAGRAARQEGVPEDERLSTDFVVLEGRAEIVWWNSSLDPGTALADAARRLGHGDADRAARARGSEVGLPRG